MAIRNDLIQSRSAYIGSSSSVSPSVGNLVVDGNVGIGTSSPGYKLDLRSPLNTDTFAFVSGGPGLTKGGIYLGNDGTQYSSLWFDNATNDLVIRQNYSSGNLILGTASTEKMRITSAGNVGIGSPSPANYSGYTTLEVAASSGGVFRLKNNAESGVFEMATTSANTYIKNVTSTPMWFGTANTERMRITAGGEVYVGRTTNAAAGWQMAIKNGLTVTDGTYEVQMFGYFGAGIGTYTNHEFTFRTNNTERMRITNGGEVGIGTTTMYGKLSVSSGNFDGIRIDTNAGYNAISIGGTGAFSIDAPGIGGGRFIVTNGGLVGIGTTSPNVSGYSRALTISSSDSGIELTSASNVVQATIGANTNGLAISGIGTFGVRIFTSASGATSERMRIAANGNVGIGTTSPGSRLEIAGALGATVGIGGSTLRLVNTDTGNTASITAGITGMTNDGMQFSTDGTVRMIIASGGNVGIGTSSPGYKLDVNGAGRFIFRNNSNEITDLLLSTESANSKSKLSFLWYGNETAAVKFLRGDNSTGSSMEFWTQQEFGSTTQRMTIASSGNVGIGTTAPASILHMTGYTPIERIDSTKPIEWTTDGEALGSINFYKHYGLAQGASIRMLQDGGTASYAQASLAFYTNDVSIDWATPIERMRIKANGNVGIGTANPTAKLQVEGNGIVINTENSNQSKFLYFRYSNGGDLRSDSYLTFSTSGSPTERMRITDVGNVGIGTSSPAAKLDIAGTNSSIALSFGNTVPNNPLFINTYGGWSGIGMSQFDAGLRLAGDYTSGSSTTLVDVGYYSSGSVSHANWVSRLRVLNTGNVGIGTTNPYSPLQVGSYTGSGGFSYGTAATFVSSFNSSRATLFVGSTDTTSTQDKGGSIDFGGGSEAGSTPYTYARIKGYKEVAGGGYSGYLSFSTTPAGSDANTERMRINSLGNVGIGSSNPYNGSRLEVRGSGVWDGGTITLTNSGTGGRSWSLFSTNNSFAQGAGKFLIYNSTAGTDAFIIDSSNNVGIGTSSPDKKLVVVGDGSGTMKTGGPGVSGNYTGISLNGTLNIDNYNVLSSPNDNNLYINRPTGADIRFRMNNNDQVAINNSGDVGIGTTAPAARLEVYGSGSSSSTVNFLARNSSGTKIIESFDDGLIRLNNLLNSNQAIYVNSSNANRHYALDAHIFSVVNSSYSMTEFVAIKGNADIPAMGVGTINPHRSAILDLTSTNKGFLPPRMTNTQMNAISTPAAGLVVYDNTNNKLCVYNGSSWVPLH